MGPYGKVKIFILTAVIIILSTACSRRPVNMIVNPGFETGSLKGWTAFGSAFAGDCVSFSAKDENGNYFTQEGDFFYYGKANGPAATGYLLSTAFVLKGNGKIGFKIGAGKNAGLCYVALVDAAGRELAVRANDEFDEVQCNNTMHRVILDAGRFVNKTVRIKIVDNDSGNDGYNYINVDDFIINYEGAEEQVGILKKANDYLFDNINNVNRRYKPAYHASVPVGWGNDPNGLIWYKGEAHLFFQFNPYATEWGPVHWGHFTSKDFVKWELRPIALAPDQDYDKENGCFSGTAIEKDGNLYLMYTGVANGLQQQSIAVSADGIHFEKLNRNPVIPAQMAPPTGSVSDFRDPDVFFKDGDYYCLIGTRTGGFGNILLYKSETLYSWTYVGALMNNSDPRESNFYRLNGVYECPDFITLGGREVLIASPQFLPRDGSNFENIHSVVYMIGSIDYHTGKFAYDRFHELDSGFDFYAAQTMKTPDGRTVLIAWKEMWDRSYPTRKDNWVGSYTLPRELTMKDGHIYQKPVQEIENYRKNKTSAGDIIIAADQSLRIDNVSGNVVELTVVFDVMDAQRVGLKLFKGAANETLVYYDAARQKVVFDRSLSGEYIFGAEENCLIRNCDVFLENNHIELRLFLDVSSLEVFINGGYATMTGNVYADPALDTGIEFFSIGGAAKIVSLEKYDIIVD